MDANASLGEQLIRPPETARFCGRLTTFLHVLIGLGLVVLLSLPRSRGGWNKSLQGHETLQAWQSTHLLSFKTSLQPFLARQSPRTAMAQHMRKPATSQHMRSSFGVSSDNLVAAAGARSASAKALSVSATFMYHESIDAFLQDATSLGKLRFVVVGPGAILESTAAFENMRVAETPTGRLATFSETPKGESNNFELHLRMNEVKTVKLAEVEKSGKLLKIVRFLGADNAPLLSCIVQDPEGKAAEWKRLVVRYGNSFGTN